jgi:exo-beta-1,3-glucanase (GH17 family)
VVASVAVLVAAVTCQVLAALSLWFRVEQRRGWLGRVTPYFSVSAAAVAVFGALGSAWAAIAVLIAGCALWLIAGWRMSWLHPVGLQTIVSGWVFGVAELAFFAVVVFHLPSGWLRAVGIAWWLVAVLELPWRLIQGYLFQEVICRRRWDMPWQLDPALRRESGSLVSVHVPCCTEPPEVVIACLEALAAQRYRDVEIIVVDNNTAEQSMWRPVEQCCRRLGPRFRFFHVQHLAGAKAGALNFALTHTDPMASLIAVVDCDYQVDPEYLSSTVGYFADPGLAHLQLRQDYRDWKIDSYHAGMYWEYRIASGTYLVSRNEWRIPMSLGTMCLIRRSALVAAGGWLETCATEDSELSIRLHALRYRGLYFDVALGWGTVPTHFQDYRRQRHRWTRGPVQEVKEHWRMLLPGSRRPGSAAFTPAQRLISLHHGCHEFARGVQGACAVLILAAAAIMIISGKQTGIPALPLVAIAAGRLAGGAIGLRVFWSRICPSLGAAALAAVSNRSLTWVVWNAGLYGWASRQRPWGRTGKFTWPGSTRRALQATRGEISAGVFGVIAGTVTVACTPSPLAGLLLGAALLAPAWALLLAPIQAVRAERSADRALARRRGAGADAIVPAKRVLTPIPHAVRTDFRDYFADPGASLVAYATKFEYSGPPTDENMYAQLHRLREKFDGLVLYDCGRHAARVLRMAAELDYHAALLTIWNLPSWVEQIRAAALLRRHGRRLILAVCLGSEGLLMHRYTDADLLAAYRRMRRLADPIPVEITSTEPWSYYLEPAHSAALTQVCDFLMPNVHAIWDAYLSDPEDMAIWTAEKADELQTALGRPVLIREAGVPGGGRPPRRLEGLTEFDRQIQAEFWRAWLKLKAQGRVPSACAFEAIDNPDKLHMSDFEPHWGLLRANHELTAWPAWDVFPALRETLGSHPERDGNGGPF